MLYLEGAGCLEGGLELVGDGSEALGRIISRHGELRRRDGAWWALLVILLVVLRIDHANVG